VKVLPHIQRKASSCSSMCDVKKSASHAFASWKLRCPEYGPVVATEIGHHRDLATIWPRRRGYQWHVLATGSISASPAIKANPIQPILCLVMESFLPLHMDFLSRISTSDSAVLEYDKERQDLRDWCW
jgi:hypothetical protein